MTERFARVPVWIASRRLTKNEHRVLVAICSFVDRRGFCWPSLDKIAEITGLPRKKLPAFTRGLADKDVITIIRSKGRSSNRYFVHYEEPSKRNKHQVSPGEGPIGASSVPRAGAQTAQESNQPTEQLRPAHAPSEIAGRANARAEVGEAIEQWNKLASRYGLAMVHTPTPKLCLALQHCLAKDGGLEAWEAAIGEIENSLFLLGHKGEFRVTLEWMVRPNNLSNVVRGKYRPSRSSAGATPLGDILFRSLRARSGG